MRATAELEADGEVYDRPRTRGDCADGPRPCPWVSCRHHLYLDVNAESGTITLRFPDLQPEEMGASCSLDVADGGGQDLETVGRLIGDVSKEMARLVEAKALRSMRIAIWMRLRGGEDE